MISRQAIRIHLVRHGETRWNALDIYQGTSDVPLSARGRLQAEALAAALRPLEFAAAYVSPLARARDTMRHLLRGRGISPIVHADLREMSYGLWQGWGPGARARSNPGLVARWRDAPHTVRFPGGESLEDVRIRASRFLDDCVSTAPGGDVLVVAHGNVNRVIVLHALGRDLREFWAVRQANASRIVIELERVTHGTSRPLDRGVPPGATAAAPGPSSTSDGDAPAGAPASFHTRMHHRVP